MKLTKTLKSEIDQSVNFIFEGNFPGFYEARFVRRAEKYFIAYFSPQSGCPKRCSFCHLTTTGQLEFRDATESQLALQVQTVIDYYNQLVEKGEPKAEVLHISGMARGNVTSSQTFLNYGDEVIEMFNKIAIKNKLLPKVMLSDIISSEMRDRAFTDVFKTTQPNIYYSLYSMSEKFRKKWMPNALPAKVSLQKLKDWQDHTNKIIRLHWAFIEGENDSPKDIAQIVEAVNDIGLRVDVNIVRYNPFSPKEGKEPHINHIASLETLLKEGLPNAKVKTVSRVGQDVYGSCGLFFPK